MSPVIVDQHKQAEGAALTGLRLPLIIGECQAGWCHRSGRSWQYRRGNNVHSSGRKDGRLRLGSLKVLDPSISMELLRMPTF
jgi:hypothetical protein